MSTLFTLLILAAVAVFLILLFLGMFVALGILLVFVFVVAGISALFGGLDFNTSQTSVLSSIDFDKNEIPQEFNACLLGSDLDLCRKNFTHWGPDEMKIIEKLAKQVKEDLGARGESQGDSNQEMSSWNGDVTIVIEQTTKFSKQDAVRERYVLKPDEKDEDHPYKIKELNWDY